MPTLPFLCQSCLQMSLAPRSFGLLCIPWIKRGSERTFSIFVLESTKWGMCGPVYLALVTDCRGSCRKFLQWIPPPYPGHPYCPNSALRTTVVPWYPQVFGSSHHQIMPFCRAKFGGPGSHGTQKKDHWARPTGIPKASATLGQRTFCSLPWQNQIWLS